jgi:hypothetical protein
VAKPAHRGSRPVVLQRSWGWFRLVCDKRCTSADAEEVVKELGSYRRRATGPGDGRREGEVGGPGSGAFRMDAAAKGVSRMRVRVRVRVPAGALSDGTREAADAYR